MATKDCSASSCQHQEGIGESTFNVQPYLIYQHTGRLSREYVELLMEMVQEGSSFWSDAAKGRVYDSVTEPLIEALELLEKESVAAALAAAGPAIETVHFIYLTGEAFYKLGKQLGFVAGLLTALNMPGIGIGVDDPFEVDIPDAPTGVFRSALLSGLANSVSVGQGGILWSDAEALEEQYKAAGKAFAVQPEEVNVKVYEVSHCNMNKPNCGPGYKGSPGSSPRCASTSPARTASPSLYSGMPTSASPTTPPPSPGPRKGSTGPCRPTFSSLWRTGAPDRACSHQSVADSRRVVTAPVG